MLEVQAGVLTQGAEALGRTEGMEDSFMFGHQGLPTHTAFLRYTRSAGVLRPDTHY